MVDCIVIGLDGANWRIIQPWLENGELPNMAKLREEGAYGDLDSCLPAVTLPNWRCYATGRTPRQLGVYWFEKVDMGEDWIRPVDAEDFTGAALWNYLNEEGLTTGVLNMPSTYPCEPVDGFMVSGGPLTEIGYEASGDDEAFHPIDIRDTLQERFDYQIHPTPLLTSREDSDEAVDAVLDLIDTRFEAAEYLLEEEDPDFFHATIFYLNVLQHFFWRGNPTKQGWKLVDEWLGRFKTLADKHDAQLLVFSDHGSDQIKTMFHVNHWLEEQDLFAVETGVEDAFYRFGITQETLAHLAKAVGADKLLSYAPDWLKKVFPREEGVMQQQLADKIDWDETRAVGQNQGAVYMDRDIPEETVARVKEELEALTYNGEPVLNAVHRLDDLYPDGERTGSDPALLLEQADGVHISGAVKPGKQVFDEKGRWEADNHPTGLFLLYGDDVQSGVKLGNASMIDLAPTLLHLYDVDIPTDMQGTPITAAFTENSAFRERDPGRQEPLHTAKEEETEKKEAAVRERLKGLGYLQ